MPFSPFSIIGVICRSIFEHYCDCERTTVASYRSMFSTSRSPRRKCRENPSHSFHLLITDFVLQTIYTKYNQIYIYIHKNMNLRLVDAAVVEDKVHAGKLLPRLLWLEIQLYNTLVTCRVTKYHVTGGFILPFQYLDIKLFILSYTVIIL